MAEGATTTKGGTITLRNLSKNYGPVLAVADLNLEIKAGEFVTLLGPSGSGKTTILMMIAGFVVPSVGNILVDDVSIVTLPPFNRNLGVVFQHYSLFPHMTVFKNVAFPLEMRSVSKPEIAARVNRALDIVQLPGMGERRPNQLSGGQQQRVALARALVFEPPLLLLDEPLGALDLKLRQELQIEIKRIHEEVGVTAIAVTHDQGEALSMSDRIIVMNDGVIQQDGTPEETYNRPANPFVANFIGATNLLNGALVSQDGAACVVELADGTRISGVSANPIEDPNNITMSIRPESIVPVGEGDQLSNTFDAVVEGDVYLGTTTKYTMKIGPSTVINTDWQNRGGVSALRRGEHVKVGWMSENAQIV